MTIIHCDGHEFDEFTASSFGNKDPHDKWWVCGKCNLRVTRESAMKQLTGKTC